MLENSDNEKPKEIHIENEQWEKINELTLKHIVEKLDAARELLKLGKFDNISTGLYTYAIEEYGKLLLLHQSENIANNTKKKIKYSGEFTCQQTKFKKALYYLRDISKTSHKCYILNNKGVGFPPKDYTWQGFDIGLLEDFEARMSIFYSDFSYKKNEKGEPTDKIIITEIPEIDRECLKDAIDELSSIIDELSIIIQKFKKPV